MSDLLKDLKNYILAELFSDFDEDDDDNFIFLDSLPDTPDTVIVISEYPGKDYAVFDERKIQILCRDASYSSAKSQATSIRELLSSNNIEQVVSVGESADRKLIIKSLQPPFKLDIDTRERIVFCCNYQIVVTSRD